MFAGVGVRIEWHSRSSCPAGIEPITVRLSNRVQDGRSRVLHLRVVHPTARHAQRERHVPRTPFGESDSRNLQIRVRIGKRVFVFEFEPQQQFAVRVERPCVSLRKVLVLRYAQISAAVGTPCTPLRPSFRPFSPTPCLWIGKRIASTNARTAPGSSACVSSTPCTPVAST